MSISSNRLERSTGRRFADDEVEGAVHDPYRQERKFVFFLFALSDRNYELADRWTLCNEKRDASQTSAFEKFLTNEKRILKKNKMRKH